MCGVALGTERGKKLADLLDLARPQIVGQAPFLSEVFKALVRYLDTALFSRKDNSSG